MYFSWKVGYFLTYSIVSVCLWTNISNISGVYISKSKQYYNAKPSTYYFYVNTKILIDFHICISVPLSAFKSGFKNWWPRNWPCSLCKQHHQILALYKVKKATQICDDILVFCYPAICSWVLRKMLWRGFHYY